MDTLYQTRSVLSQKWTMLFVLYNIIFMVSCIISVDEIMRTKRKIKYEIIKDLKGVSG
jgi:membrane-anchored protein YejM (alkaline phosphatase superfamily)